MHLHLKFFISSPGDVADERQRARELIEQRLPKDAMLGRDETLSCEVVSHDDPVRPVAMIATEGPQVSVDRQRGISSQCDVVIVILWSKLGTPLATENYVKPDGSAYGSGTEKEFEDAVLATPTPHVLVYASTRPPPYHAMDPDYATKSAEYARLAQFLVRFGKQDGVYRSGLNPYREPAEFEAKLTSHLKGYIRSRFDQLRASRLEQASADDASDQPPYHAIARALADGMLLPFIGAGVQPGRHSSEGPAYLPSSDELSGLLAKSARLNLGLQSAHDHLAEIATYVEAKDGRESLREQLRRLLGPHAIEHAARPPLYSVLARVQRPLLIITTNYDTQLERAFLEAGRAYDLVVYPSTDVKHAANAVLWWQHGQQKPLTPAPNALTVDLNTTTVIFKMHGSIQPDGDDWDSTVITEADYVQLLSRVGESAIPSAVLARIRNCGLLFVGFSLRDWPSRTVLRSLRWGEALPGETAPRSWSAADHFEAMELMLWRNRQVVPLQVGADDFAAGLDKEIPA